MKICPKSSPETKRTICSEREQVSLEYVSHCQRGDLLDVIQRDRAKDRIMGYSLHGTHKDDLVMKQGLAPLRRQPASYILLHHALPSASQVVPEV